MQRKERCTGRIDSAKGFQYLCPAICPVFAGQEATPEQATRMVGGTGRIKLKQYNL